MLFVEEIVTVNQNTSGQRQCSCCNTKLYKLLSTHSYSLLMNNPSFLVIRISGCPNDPCLVDSIIRLTLNFSISPHSLGRAKRPVPSALSLIPSVISELKQLIYIAQQFFPISLLILFILFHSIYLLIFASQL